MPSAKRATISKSRQPPRFLVHEPWPKATLRAPYVQILRNRPRCFRGHHRAKMTNRESRARDSLMTSRFWRANASCLGYPQLRLSPRGLFGIGPSLAESANSKSWWTRPTLQSHASRTGGAKSSPRPAQRMGPVHLSQAQVSVRLRESHEKMRSSCFPNHVPYLPQTSRTWPTTSGNL